MNIGNLHLSDFVPVEALVEKDFEYAGLKGRAELIGWQIVFFRTANNLEIVSAINLEDISIDSELIGIASEILRSIDFPIHFGDNFHSVQAAFGNPISQDELLEGITRYNFLLQGSDLFACLAVAKDDGVCSVEIVQNKDIIAERLSF